MRKLSQTASSISWAESDDADPTDHHGSLSVIARQVSNFVCDSALTATKASNLPPYRYQQVGDFLTRKACEGKAKQDAAFGSSQAPRKHGAGVFQVPAATVVVDR